MRALHQDIGKPPAPHDGRAGSALIAVLGVSMILMLAGVTMVILSRQSIHRVQRMVNYEQAQAAAESGVADMVAKLFFDYSSWLGTTIHTNFISNGAYHVTSQLQPNNRVLVISDGLYMGVSNRTVLELIVNPDPYNLNSAIMSGGNTRFDVGIFTINGDIHANQNITTAWFLIPLTYVTINDNIWAVGTIDHWNAFHTGTKSNGVPSRPLPVFNFESYRQMAIDDGTYLEGNRTLSGINLKQPATANDILYVNGNLTINGASTFTGTIVANGNININGLLIQNQNPINPNMPALLSTGNIVLGIAGCSINGLVYSKVDTKMLFTLTYIHGGVVSLGITRLGILVQIDHGDNLPAWDPLNPVVPIIIGGWLK